MNDPHFLYSHDPSLGIARTLAEGLAMGIFPDVIISPPRDEYPEKGPAIGA
jgi:hypothetical protein